ALRAANVTRGDYLVPHPGGRENMRSEEYKAKVKRGPVATLTVMTGFFDMGKRLTQWFIYLLVVGAFSAYVAGHVFSPRFWWHAVFRVVWCVSFAAYGLALWQGSIWYGRSWATALKSNIDAAIYAAITAGIFSWLWPM